MNRLKTLRNSIVVVSLIVTILFMTGCFGGGGSDADENVIRVSQTSYQIQKNAVNNMVNNALKFTVTDMQRRPMSAFSGSNIDSNDSLTGTSDTRVSASATNDIVVQIDVSYTWNVNTYADALAERGVKLNRVPGVLSDLFAPGSLMYVQGEDADGNKYQSADIISPKAQSNVNQLAINSQWDYDVMNSSLPETSVTKTGSFLLRVPSTAKNLKLVIITPVGGQDVTDTKNITNGNIAVYELPLT